MCMLNTDQRFERIRDSREGFALPAAILAVAVVAILITGGFHMANQEHRVGVSSERATHAFYVAEDGLSVAVSDHHALPGSFWGGSEWSFGSPQEFTGSRGTATVRAQRVNDDGLYYIMSTGQIQEGASEATRSVGLMVRRRSAQIDIDGALTTQGAVEVRGSSMISGHDAAPANWDHCTPGESKPGVIVGPDGDVSTRGQAEVTGDPDWTEDEDINNDTFSEFGDLSWDDLTASADIVIPTDGSSGGTYNLNNMAASLDGDGECNTWNRHAQTGDLWNWGYPYDRDDPTVEFAPCHTHFPTIHVKGTARVQSGGYGQGILLVDGDLDLRGDFNWFGIVIVQGQLQTQGSGNRIFGGALARNADLDLQTYVGGSVIQYSSCVINDALTYASGLTQIQPLARRGWIDLAGQGF